MSENAAKEIIEYIKNSKKTTTVKVYVNGHDLPSSDTIKVFGTPDSRVLIGEHDLVCEYLDTYKDLISDTYMENNSRNQAVPLANYTKYNARIEPGAIIRDRVEIGNNAVIMMGAIINIGVKVGEGTMVDMGCVLGGRVEVGKHCHIGAGTVLAGVVEPPNATPVIIEDDVVIGANAVVIEGVRVGKGAVVGAGSIVLKDVPAGAVVVGNPARIIKEKDEKTGSKTQLMDDLRKL